MLTECETHEIGFIPFRPFALGTTPHSGSR